MKPRVLFILCSLACTVALSGCAGGPAALIPPLAASALRNLPEFNNSPAALAAIANAGSTGTTVIKGRTATVIIKDGKTIVIPRRQPVQ